MPTLTRSPELVFVLTSPPRTGARSRPAVAGRGLVWWQMSAAAISTRRGIVLAARRRRPPGSAAMPISCFSAFSQATKPAAPPAHADGVRQLVELLRHRLGVPGQHGVDHQRVGQAVVQVADGAERMRAGVHRAQVLLEGDRAHHRAHHHVAARACRLPGSRTAVEQRARGDARAFERDAVAQRVVGRRQVALDVVRQRVHAGGGGHRRRQAERQLGVGEHHLGQDLRREDHALDVRVVLADDAAAADLAAGARGRRQGDEVRQRRRRSARTCGWSQTYSITSPSCVASRPTTLATSSAAPPPMPMTQSAPCALYAAAPSITWLRGRVAEHAAVDRRREAGGRRGSAVNSASSGSAARPLSVTISGRFRPCSLQVRADELARAGAEVDRASGRRSG